MIEINLLPVREARRAADLRQQVMQLVFMLLIVGGAIDDVTGTVPSDDVGDAPGPVECCTPQPDNTTRPANAAAIIARRFMPPRHHHLNNQTLRTPRPYRHICAAFTAGYACPNSLRVGVIPYCPDVDTHAVWVQRSQRWCRGVSGP